MRSTQEIPLALFFDYFSGGAIHAIETGNLAHAYTTNLPYLRRSIIYGHTLRREVWLARYPANLDTYTVLLLALLMSHVAPAAHSATISHCANYQLLSWFVLTVLIFQLCHVQNVSASNFNYDATVVKTVPKRAANVFIDNSIYD